MIPADIVLSGVSSGYGGIPVLRNVDLTVQKGEFLGVVGPNGGGKSTLLRTILGLLEPLEGTVQVLGGHPAAVRERLGYVPQAARFDLSFPITVSELVMQARLRGGLKLLARPSRADREVVGQALEEMGVAHLGKRPVADLSGGELQRALIARALAGKPEVLFLDEPTASVDSEKVKAIFDILERLTRTEQLPARTEPCEERGLAISRTTEIGVRAIRQASFPAEASPSPGVGLGTLKDE